MLSFTTKYIANNTYICKKNLKPVVTKGFSFLPAFLPQLICVNIFPY